MHLAFIQPAGGTDEIADFRGRHDARQGEHPDGVQGFAAVRAGILHAVPGQQVHLGVRPGHHCEAVLFHVLFGAAPAFASRLGAFPPDDEAHLAHILRHVHHTFNAVFAGMEQLAAAILSGKPHPHVACIVIRVRIGPVQRQLAASRLFFQEKLAFLRPRARKRRAKEQQRREQDRQDFLQFHSARPFHFPYLPVSHARPAKGKPAGHPQSQGHDTRWNIQAFFYYASIIKNAARPVNTRRNEIFTGSYFVFLLTGKIHGV